MVWLVRRASEAADDRGETQCQRGLPRITASVLGGLPTKLWNACEACKSATTLWFAGYSERPLCRDGVFN